MRPFALEKRSGLFAGRGFLLLRLVWTIARFSDSPKRSILRRIARIRGTLLFLRRISPQSLCSNRKTSQLSICTFLFQTLNRNFYCKNPMILLSSYQIRGQICMEVSSHLDCIDPACSRHSFLYNKVRVRPYGIDRTSTAFCWRFF